MNSGRCTCKPPKDRFHLSPNCPYCVLKDKTIEKYRDAFKGAGFDDYDLDLSSIQPELIEKIGKACLEWIEEQKEKSVE